MDIVKKIVAWFIFSSQPGNGEKLSLTLKSIAAFGVLFGLDQSVVDEGVASLTATVVGLGMALSALSGVYGFVRKLYNTYKNPNAA